jgi:hypothetical protein
MEEKRNAYRILVGKSEGKRPLGRPRHRWMASIKMNIWLGEVSINKKWFYNHINIS